MSSSQFYLDSQFYREEKIESPNLAYLEEKRKEEEKGSTLKGTRLFTINSLKKEETEEGPSIIEFKLIDEIEDNLRKKLKNGIKLTENDRLNIEEMAEISGWSKDDIMNDLKKISKDYQEYLSLFKKYYNEAESLKDKDSRQSSEKLWGAITALMKAYAIKSGVIISQWSRSKLDKFVENNIPREWKKDFYNLLSKGDKLHKHFYEGHMTSEHFNMVFNECKELIKKF
ncbi:MAG: PaREP1 family protein [Nitrososphaerota archaeon]